MDVVDRVEIVVFGMPAEAAERHANVHHGHRDAANVIAQVAKQRALARRQEVEVPTREVISREAAAVSLDIEVASIVDLTRLIRIVDELPECRFDLRAQKERERERERERIYVRSNYLRA